MENLKYLIVGCGRSGTGFAAEYVKASGKYCGHEEVFDVYGFHSHSENIYESSWYAAPLIPLFKQELKILHVVRKPTDVIRSFYRMGILAQSNWRHITEGKPLKFVKNALKHPSRAKQRLCYVEAHKFFLGRHSSVLKHACEIKRLEAYWCEWNKMIESYSSLNNHKYLRVKIEDFWDSADEIGQFLNLVPSEQKDLTKNEKTFFKKRPINSIHLDPSTINLAKTYGYTET